MAGPIIAGVLTAAALILAGVQTGLIASQTFHGQEGGLLNKGQITGDNNLLFANKGEALFQDNTYKNLVTFLNDYQSGTAGGGSQPIIVNITLDDNLIGKVMVDRQRNDRIR